MSKAGKSQLVYLLRILEYCGKIRVYLKNLDNYSDFFNSGEQLHFNASLILLIQIGEQSVKVGDFLKEKQLLFPGR